MHVKMTKIGKSQGVFLPQTVIRQAGLGRDMDIDVGEGVITIKKAKVVRKGWAKAAAECAKEDRDSFSEWDATIGDFSGEW